MPGTVFWGQCQLVQNSLRQHLNSYPQKMGLAACRMSVENGHKPLLCSNWELPKKLWTQTKPRKLTMQATDA